MPKKRQVKEKTKENQSHGKKKNNRGKHNPHDKAYGREEERERGANNP